MPSRHVPPPEPPTSVLRGRCLLVVENDYILATDLAEALQEQGAQVIGPAACVEDALGLIASAAGIHGALIEADLGGEPAYPVVEVLRREGVPFAFVSGYDTWAIPQAYADAPHFEKPVNTDSFVPQLAKALWGEGQT